MIPGSKGHETRGKLQEVIGMRSFVIRPVTKVEVALKAKINVNEGNIVESSNILTRTMTNNTSLMCFCFMSPDSYACSNIDFRII